MTRTGEVIYVEARGPGITRIGARVGDAVYWWTCRGPAPARGQLVEIPAHAKAEKARDIGQTADAPAAAEPKAEAPAPSAEEVERMLRSVALKAAASLYAGHGTEAKELVLGCAAEFLAWLRGAS